MHGALICVVGLPGWVLPAGGGVVVGGAGCVGAVGFVVPVGGALGAVG
jgi:hypothetical protein